MNLLGNSMILVLLILLGVVILNLLLISSVQSHAKRVGRKSISQMLRSIREPFQEGESDLDELSRLVEKLTADENIQESSGSK